MLAKKTSKNQITLPKAIVNQIPNVDYFEVMLRSGDVVLRPVVVTTPGENLRRVRAKMKRLGIREQDVSAAIRWARTRR